MNKTIRLTLLAAAVCLVGGATVGVAQEATQHQHQHPAPTGNTAQVVGTLHTVDAAKRTVNIDHPAVPEFKWPAMRMDFAVAKDIKLDGLKTGQAVHFTITKSDQGTFSITQIMPAH